MHFALSPLPPAPPGTSGERLAAVPSLGEPLNNKVTETLGNDRIASQPPIICVNCKGKVLVILRGFRQSSFGTSKTEQPHSTVQHNITQYCAGLRISGSSSRLALQCNSSCSSTADKNSDDLPVPSLLGSHVTEIGRGNERRNLRDGMVLAG